MEAKSKDSFPNANLRPLRSVRQKLRLAGDERAVEAAVQKEGTQSKVHLICSKKKSVAHHKVSDARTAETQRIDLGSCAVSCVIGQLDSEERGD